MTSTLVLNEGSQMPLGDACYPYVASLFLLRAVAPHAIVALRHIV
jgi:hypothetical protein